MCIEICGLVVSVDGLCFEWRDRVMWEVGGDESEYGRSVW